jgi:6-phosphogluconate dehydrogenase
MPSNLVQAQRDYFGAHTYELIGKEGFFHTQWLAENTDDLLHNTPSAK